MVAKLARQVRQTLLIFSNCCLVCRFPVKCIDYVERKAILNFIHASRPWRVGMPRVATLTYLRGI